MLGDFSALFPWSLGNDFDIISVAVSPGQAMYLHGQLTFFKWKSFREKWPRLPPFASPDTFLEFRHEWGMDEYYWSRLLIGPGSNDLFDWYVAEDRLNCNKCRLQAMTMSSFVL